MLCKLTLEIIYNVSYHRPWEIKKIKNRKIYLTKQAKITLFSIWNRKRKKKLVTLFYKSNFIQQTYFYTKIHQVWVNLIYTNLIY